MSEFDFYSSIYQSLVEASTIVIKQIVLNRTSRKRQLQFASILRDDFKMNLSFQDYCSLCMRIQVFLMFCCFSKKKKKTECNAPRPLPRRTKYKQRVAIPQTQLQAIPEKGPEESQTSNRQFSMAVGSKQFNIIDNILKGEIEQMKTKQQPEEQVKERKPSKFCDINDESQSISGQQDERFQRCNMTPSDELEERSRGPKKLFKTTHSFEDMDSMIFASKKENSSLELESSTKKQSERWSLKTEGYKLDQIKEEENQSCLSTLNPNIETAITLQNFHHALQRMNNKVCSDELDETLNETFEQAENGFYCRESDINQQFSRAVIAYETPDLAKLLFQKMTKAEKNKIDSKGYTPVQLVVMKTLRHQKYVDLAKLMSYHENVDLQCRNLSGWTPLQIALIHRNIPLSTNLFRAVYMKRQQTYRKGLSKLEEVLTQMPDFTIEIEVRVDSFIPLVGALTPSDTLKIKKVGGRISLDYSLVGYTFPICKRRQMSIYFDGSNMYGLNYSKGIYCDLLQDLDQQEMLLLIQDMLTSEIKRGQPIIHDISLSKTLSLFDNQITQEIGGFTAKKYQLNLRYTSTAEKRKSTQNNVKQLNFVNSYGDYQVRKEEMVIKQKNKNKKMELQVWLAEGVELEIMKLVDALQILGAGNNLLSQWSTFLKDKIGDKLEEKKFFPVKIDVPLDYSLYFNIEFGHLTLLDPGTTPLSLPQTLTKVERKQFQGLLQSRNKRKLLLQAYT